MPTWLAIGTGMAFLAVFLLIASLNWWNLLNTLRGRKSGSSIPLIGGLCGFLGLILLGKCLGEATGKSLWLPLVLDWGTLPLITWTLIFFLFVLPFISKGRKSD
jgi:hypothetical protein